MIKRILSVILIFSTLIALSACGEIVNGDKINIVCTTYATYDWTREIVGDNVDKFELTLLGDGVDLHSFQPTTADIAKIHTADLFIQIGGTTEDWTQNLNLGDKALRLFDLLGDTEKLCIKDPHMQLKFSEDNYDEHIWLSLKRAERMVTAISERICNLDTANGVKYQKNCVDYIEALRELDQKYYSVMLDSKDKTVIFADRYPFAYMMFDYGINCISAFDSCSSDADASFDTIAHLAEAVKKYDKDTVLVLENSAESVAEPLKSALTDREINTAVMNSCQTISTAESTSYIDIMTQNLKSFKAALRG